jgi:hypothetical protein
MATSRAQRTIHRVWIDGRAALAAAAASAGCESKKGRDNVNSWSGNHHTHLVTKTWLPDALLRGCPSPRALRSRLPDALL